MPHYLYQIYLKKGRALMLAQQGIIQTIRVGTPYKYTFKNSEADKSDPALARALAGGPLLDDFWQKLVKRWFE